MFFSVVVVPVLRFKTNCIFTYRKTVAVTSNRGTGRAPLRPALTLSWSGKSYQNKILRGKAGTDSKL